MTDATTTPAPSDAATLPQIFLVFLRLGLTSFGGPVAHLGYFRHEFVERRRWLDEHAYADVVGLCQFLPGPASSQVGMAIGLSRGGVPGAIAAFLGFTLPSALLLVLFALAVSRLGGLDYSGYHDGGPMDGGWLHGLKVVAVAVVAQALWGMGRTLAPDRERATLAVAGAVLATWLPSAFGQVLVIAAAGLAGWRWLPATAALPPTSLTVPVSRRTGALCLAAFALLLLALPMLAVAVHGYPLALFAGFYRAGALVFGGGHVVLPLLQAQVVPSGWVDNDAFLAGYGAAQAVPGPLFTFAAYLGAMSNRTPAGWIGALIATCAIFLPGFLLVVGALPFWDTLRRHAGVRRAMLGINAAVVGLLLAAFYQPVWTSAIRGPGDFCMATVGFVLLVFWKWPPWLVVVLGAVAAALGA